MHKSEGPNTKGSKATKTNKRGEDNQLSGRQWNELQTYPNLRRDRPFDSRIMNRETCCITSIEFRFFSNTECSLF